MTAKPAPRCKLCREIIKFTAWLKSPEGAEGMAGDPGEYLDYMKHSPKCPKRKR